MISRNLHEHIMIPFLCFSQTFTRSTRLVARAAHEEYEYHKKHGKNSTRIRVEFHMAGVVLTLAGVVKSQFSICLPWPITRSGHQYYRFRPKPSPHTFFYTPNNAFDALQECCSTSERLFNRKPDILEIVRIEELSRSVYEPCHISLCIA